MNTYLEIPTDKYLKAYNDYTFIYHYKTFSSFDYVDTHYFGYAFKQHFPTYYIEFERDNDGHKLFYLDNKSITDKDLIQTRLDLSNQFRESASKLSPKSDYKELKKLNNEIKSINEEIFYSIRGSFVRPYVVDATTGLRTPSIEYPVIDGAMNSIINPDTRDLNDSIARGEVKVVGKYCGLFLRLFTRVDLGDNLEEAPKVKAIKAIVERSEILNLPIPDFVHFGTSFNQLKKYAQELKLQLPKEVND